MYGTLSNIAIAFIAVALLAVMVDQFTRVLQAILPFPPSMKLRLYISYWFQSPLLFAGRGILIYLLY